MWLFLSAGDFASAVDSGWLRMAPARFPTARLGHGMAYDSESDRIVLLGGETTPLSNALNNETWAYDLNADSWENRSPSARPSARFAQAMAYDAGSDRTILFGGWTGTAQSRETWAYDYNTNAWTNVTSSPSPPEGVFVAMAYDAESDRMALFGGSKDRSDFSVYSSETWAYDFDSNRWTQMSPVDSPSPRAINGMMAYDAQSDRVVLFGGRDGQQNFGDTWEYDYNQDTWTQTNPLTHPSPRHAGAMAYDPRADRVVLFGGYTPLGTSDETWVYDADSDAWRQVAEGVAPSARFGAAIADDAESGGIVLFGGYSGGDETWVLRLDSSLPAVVITSPIGGTTLESATVTVTGTATDDVAVARVDLSLDGTTWLPATGTTSWSGTLTLVAGANTIYARATDTSGNTNTVNVGVSVALGGNDGAGSSASLMDVLASLGAIAAVAVGVGAIAAVGWIVTKRRRRRPPAA